MGRNGNGASKISIAYTMVLFDSVGDFGRMRRSLEGWLAQLGERRPYKP